MIILCVEQGTVPCFKAKILDNDTQYYAKQIDIEGSDRCYGVAANEKFIAVYKYGCNGENAELVLWKKI